MSSKAKDGQRPMVDGVLDEMRNLSTAIDQLDHAIAELFGLNRTDQRGLDILAAQGPMPARALADALGLTAGGLTTVIDRLERAGYARRRPHPTDRRQVLVETTAKTAKRAAQVFGPLTTVTRQLVAGYPDDQLALIGDFLKRWRAEVLAHAQASAAPEPPARSRRSR